MRHNILFLDVDGVLNHKSWRENNDDYFDKPICAENMEHLKAIINATRAKIVLTSSYRRYWNEGKIQVDPIGDYITRMFAEYDLEIDSKTPEFEGNDRKAEIEAWLLTHQEQVENYVIIDDVDYGYEQFFVKTDDQLGLDAKSVEKAIDILLLKPEDMRTVDKEWDEVKSLLVESIGLDKFEMWFKQMRCIGYSSKKNELLLTSHAFARVVIEEVEELFDALETALKRVFGDDADYFIEDITSDENDDFLMNLEKNNSRVEVDIFSAYDNFPELKMKKQLVRVAKIIREFPEHIFGADKDIELFNRLVLTFANAAKVSGTKNVSVTRTGDGFLELYSKDIFAIDKIKDEITIFSKSDFNRFVIRNYNKKRRYLPAPLLDSQQSYYNAFYPNVDVFFTLFCIINSSPIVEIETVKDGINSKVVFEYGLNFSRTIETLPSDKKDGSYITYKTSITNEEIYTVLERMAFFYKDFCSFTFFEPDPRTWITFNNKKDIGRYLDELTNQKCKSYWGKHKASGKDRYNKNFYKASVEFALNFDDKANVVETYYNYSLLPENNVFSDKIYEEVTKRINSWLSDKIPGRSITVSDVKKFNIMVNVCSDDDYEESTIKRESPDSRTMINDMITDIFEEDFEYFLDCYPSEVIDFVLDICKKKSEQAIENVFLDGMK